MNNHPPHRLDLGSQKPISKLERYRKVVLPIKMPSVRLRRKRR